MRLSIKVQLQCGCCCERGCGTALYWRLVDGAILGVQCLNRARLIFIVVVLMERGLLTIHYWWLVDGAILGVQCLNRGRLMRLSMKVQLHCGCAYGARASHDSLLGKIDAAIYEGTASMWLLLERGLLTIHYWWLVDGAILGVQCLNRARLMWLSMKVQLHCGCAYGARASHDSLLVVS
ncbi:hypothetical protein J6590_012806 [Homalodisca vitripennis]|nr:hypothetical protein J6590_012806 [Homalodisca vitripennis]